MNTQYFFRINSRKCYVFAAFLVIVTIFWASTVLPAALNGEAVELQGTNRLIGAGEVIARIFGEESAFVVFLSAIVILVMPIAAALLVFAGVRKSALVTVSDQESMTYGGFGSKTLSFGENPIFEVEYKFSGDLLVCKSASGKAIGKISLWLLEDRSGFLRCLENQPVELRT